MRDYDPYSIYPDRDDQAARRRVNRHAATVAAVALAAAGAASFGFWLWTGAFGLLVGWLVAFAFAGLALGGVVR